MSLLLSTGVSQRRWLVKTGRFPLKRKLTHIKGFCCCNNSQLSSGRLPGDAEIIVVFNLPKYHHRREYKKKFLCDLKASDCVCGNVIHCWPGDKHQHCNLRLTKRQTVSHLKEHILEDLCTLNKGKKYWNMNLSRSKDKVVTRDERGGSWETNRKRGSYLADFVFQIKAQATTSNKDISDRVRKWNVYSKGADKRGHMRHSRALVRTVTFCYRWGMVILKTGVITGQWKMASCALPHLIYPICMSTDPLQFQLNAALRSAIYFVFAMKLKYFPTAC